MAKMSPMRSMVFKVEGDSGFVPNVVQRLVPTKYRGAGVLIEFGILRWVELLTCRRFVVHARQTWS